MKDNPCSRHRPIRLYECRIVCPAVPKLHGNIGKQSSILLHISGGAIHYSLRSGITIPLECDPENLSSDLELDFFPDK